MNFRKGDELTYTLQGEGPRPITVLRTGQNKVVGRWYDVEDPEDFSVGPFRISERNTPGWFRSLQAR